MHAPKISRRRFLQITAATFGAATAAGALVPRVAFADAAAPVGAAGKIETIPTYCEMCFWRCGGIGYVRDGKLWKFEGNPLDPASRGRLCTRGTGAVGAHYDPDRLQKPLIRVGKRGAEEFKAVTWDEAMAFTAERLNKVRAEHGAESIALFKHGIGVRFIEHVLKHYGVINIAAPSYAQCRGPRDTGFTLTYGLGLGSPEPLDIANTNCLVLIGQHLGENMHNTQVQEFADAVGRGATVITVDPRFSVAASKSKYWLPIRPGTDTALLLAWMNVIVNEGLYDKAFVAEHGHGFEPFAAEIKRYTPEWAAKETDLDASLIRESAREMAKHRPATLVHPGRRTTWYGNDSQRVRAIALLNALLGNWGRKGGFYMQSGMKIAPYPFPPYPKSAKEKADNPKGYPFADEGLATGIREATLSAKPYPIKAWVVYSTNLVQSLPNDRETLAAIEKLDLLVAIDTHPSEIVGYADVVLPEANFLERLDELNVNWGKPGWTQIRQPVVQPPHDQQPGWWIAKRLSERLGIPECMPFKDMDEYLRYRVEKSGFSYAQLKKDGVLMGKPAPIYIDTGAEIAFDTPSGKVEFWSEQLKEKGFDPVPKHVAPDPGPKGAFRLLTGRAPMHTFGRTQTNPNLRALMAENEVWVNTRVAKDLGLENGKYVTLKNQDGVVSNRVKLRATERIRPDCVYMVHGFGHTSPMLKSAYQRGASTSRLLTRYNTDPLMGGTSVHTTFVTVSREA